ncbi:MAG: hypothetical protein WBF67_01995, partial [Olleya sp.]
MKKTLLLFLLFSSLIYSQNEEKQVTYLDTELNNINKSDFIKLSNSNLYRTQTIKNDTITIKKLGYKYEFGVLHENELAQTRHLIKKQFGIENFDKNIILTYIDTIQGFEEYKKNIE